MLGVREAKGMSRVLALALGLTPVLAGSAARAGEVLPPKQAAAAGDYEVRSILFPDLKSKSRPDREIPVRVHFPTAKGSWPVVIVSHGAGGGVDANFAQARHLATHGYMVCCVEHVGSNTERLKLKLKFWENLRDMTRDVDEVLGRPVDIKEVLDQVELWNGGHDELWGKFDLDHVAILGHSFGAYTALAVCGARPAMDWLRRDPVEALRPDRDFLRTRTSKGLAPSQSDSRVDVGVALSPQGPGEPFFVERSFATIDRPVLGISGSRDKQQGASPENRKRFLALTPVPETLLVWLHGVEHAAFSDPTGSGRTGLPSATRRSAQPVVRAATLYFLDAHLKRRAESLAMLTSETLGSVAGNGIPEVEVFRKTSDAAATAEDSPAEDAAPAGSDGEAETDGDREPGPRRDPAGSRVLRLRDVLERLVPKDP